MVPVYFHDDLRFFKVVPRCSSSVVNMCTL
uniref:Uncharacterized protein n=1 Tax=Arundo donax TaxID=35708 RepID=A0A0A8ZV62_ARUDO